MNPEQTVSHPRNRAFPVLIVVLSLVLGALVTTAFAQPLPIVSGTAGDDVIDHTYRTTPGEAETINGLGGNDTIDGGGGNDIITGDDGDDTIHGGDGNDTIDAGSDRDKVFGDTGNDTLFGHNDDDFLDGGDGVDRIEGGGGSDVIIGRGGNDTLISSQGDDFVVIIGNSTTGYQIYDILAPNGAVTDAGDDLLFFARDINPDQVTYEPLNGTLYAELNHGLMTNQPVDIDLIRDTNVRHIEAIVTGSANDTVAGSNRTDSDNGTFYGRMYDAAREAGVNNPQVLSVDEMFLTGPGNDTITTRGGDDLIDAGEGNDTLIAGPGAHWLTTGPGSDTIRYDGAATYDNANLVRVLDFGAGDKIQLLGPVAAAAVTKTEITTNGAPTTRVKIGPKIKFLLYAPTADVGIAAISGGVEIRNTNPVPPPPVPPVQGLPGSDVKQPATGGPKPPATGGTKPAPTGGTRPPR